MSAQMPDVEVQGEEQVARTADKANGSTGTVGFDRRRILDGDGILDGERFEVVEAELVQGERWEDLASLYALGAERAPGPELGRKMLLSAGLLWLEKLEDPRRAEPFLRCVLASDPESLDALDALRDICISAGRFDEAADVLDRLAAMLGDEERVDVLVEIAGIAYTKLAETDRALVALRYAYDLDPSRADVLEEARTVYVAEERWLDAKRVLDDEARLTLGDAFEAPVAAVATDETAAEDGEEQDTVYEPHTTADIKLAAAAVEGGAGVAGQVPEELAESATRIAEAYRLLGVNLLEHAVWHDLAKDCLERARALGDAEALSKLDELAHIKNDWEARATRYRDEGMEARDKRRAAALYLKAAQLYAHYGMDPIRADEYLDRCLILVPGYAPALRFIEASYLETGRTEDLVKRLDGMVAGTKDPSIKVEILVRLAHLLETHLERIEEGEDTAPTIDAIINAYRRALALAPAHRVTAIRVSAILSSEGRFAEAAQVMESHLAALTDDYAKNEAHLELGRIYAEMLGDSDRARAHFEAVLVHNPSHFEAARALYALYKDANEAPHLLSVLKVLVAYSPDLFGRLEMLHEMATVAAEVSKEDAFFVNRQIFELDPEAKGVRDRLEELAEQLSRHHALADAYAAAAERKSGDRAVTLWLAAARIYDEKLPRPKDAIHAYKTALSIDAKNDEARQALERLLREQDDPGALVEVLKSQLEENRGSDGEALILAKIGDVLDRELGDLDGAIDMFTQVLDKAPENATALANLDDLYRRTERYAELEAILVRREATMETSGDLAEIQARRARLLDENLDKREEAADLYLDVLSRFPDHGEAIRALAGILEVGIRREPIAKALEPVYAQRGDYASQIDMLRILAEAEEDTAKTRDLARRAAQIAEGRLADSALAFELITIALTADPASEELADALLRHAAEIEAPKRAADVLETILAKSDLSGEVESNVASSLAELMERSLSDPDGAIESYQRALAADGSNVGAIAALERLLGAQERYGDLAELFADRFTRAEERGAKVQLGLALASIRAEHLGDADGAVEAYREVLAIEPKESTALAKLAESYERAERWRELVGVLDRMREAASDPRVEAQADVKAGEVYRLRLNDKKSALERYKRALEVDDSDGAAVRGLEALLEDVELRAQAGQLLEPFYEKSNRPRDLVLALESQLGAVAEADKRHALFTRIAKIEDEELDTPDGAYETMSRAFREGLVPGEDRPKLANLALRANRAKDLANLYEDTLETRSDDADLIRELARLYDGAAGEPTKARTAWERLRAAVPGDEEALGALERLTAGGDDPSALADVLIARADASSDPAERVAFLKRASAIFEEAAEDLPLATRTMERARDIVPTERSTWQELQRLYEEQDNTDLLIKALAEEAKLIEDPLSKATVLEKLGRTLVKSGDRVRAILEYSAALSAKPDYPGARAGLEELLESDVGPKAALALEPVYRAAGDWSHLVEAYEILAGASEDPAERVERLVAIRSIYEERLGKLDRAFAAAARAYRDAPRDEELLSSLERLGRLSGQVDELIALLEDQAEALPYVSEERAEVRLRLAHYTETLVRDRDQAIEAYNRCLEERPDNLPALEALERIYSKGGEARELVDVVRRMAGLLEDPAERTARLRFAAQILEEKLGDRDGAAHLYEQVLMFVEGDPDALAALDRIYTETRQFTELARILAAQAEATEGEPRAQALLRLGQLRIEHLQDPRGALDAIATALSAGPDAGGAYDGGLFALDELVENLKATNPELAAEGATILEPHWLAKGLPLKVIQSKEAQVAVADDPEARHMLLLDIADLYEQEAEQPEMAFLALTRAYAERPNDGDIAEKLERLATVADTEEELADIYAQAMPSIEDAELQLRLARRTAHIYDNVLGRGDAAVPFYGRVLELVPDDASALNALERIHRRAGDAKRLVDTYRGMLRLAADDTQQRVQLWSQIAQIQEGELGDMDGAFEAYREMMTLLPEDVGVLRKMAALCERSNRDQDLAMVLAKEASLTEDPQEKSKVLLRLGTLQRERIDDPASAVDAFAEVLELAPEDPGAIAGLSAIARSQGAGRAEAARALAPVYRASGAFEEFIACLEIQISASRDPKQRKALFAEIASVYEDRLGRAEHAFTYLTRALREDLFDEALFEKVEELAKENALFEDLAALYLDEVDDVTDHALMLRLRRRVAEIYDQDLKDVPRAIAEYNKVLDVAPGDSQALRALERLYREAGSFGSLADVYRRRIAQTDDQDGRAKLMREFARLQSEELDDLPGAIATLRRLLDLLPEDVDALSRLAKLCAAQGRASELSDVLSRLIAAAEDGSKPQTDAKFELAKLKATKLGDIGGSDVLFGEVLAVEPSHEEAIEFLEERFEDAVAEDDTATAVTAGELLTKAFRESEQWEQLISVLRVRVSIAGSAHERVPLNREIAEVQQTHLEEPKEAFNTLATVFVDAPGLGDVRAGLEALAEQLIRPDRLVEVYESGLDNLHDPDERIIVERRIAQILDHEIGDKDRSAEAWQRVLRARPEDEEALAALDRLDEVLGRWAALTDVLEKRVEISEDDDEKHRLCVRLGATWDERLGEQGEAIEWYRRARELKGDDKDTLLALSLLLDAKEQPDELFEVLEALAEGTEDNRSWVRLKSRMAELAAGPLDNGKQAIELWQAVREKDSHNAAAVKALEELYEREGQWFDLAKHLEEQLENARDEKDVLRLQRRLGLVRGTRLGSTDEAIRSWTEILKRNPNDVEALDALRRTYREADRWDDLVATLRKLIPLQIDAGGVKEIRFELAEVFLNHLDQKDEAIESAKRVLDVEPHTVAELIRLEEIFGETGAYTEAVKVMNARVEQADTAGEKVDILFEIAATYEQKVGRKAGAAAAYEQVLELEPDSLKAHESLAAIYEQNGDYRKLVELYNQRLNVTEEADERRRLLFAIIDVQERWLGQPELAFTAACRAFAEEGADEQAQTLAERLADETDNWEILAEVYEEQVEQVGVQRAIDLRRRLGEIYLEKLEEEDEAEKQFELVLSMKPEEEIARQHLVDLFTKTERWNDLIAQLREKVELTSEIEDKKHLFFRIAEIEEQKLEDIEAAISSLKRVLDLETEDPKALHELVRIFRSSEKWHPLLNALGRQLELAEEQEDQIRLRYEIAQVWEQGIEDLDRAIEQYGDVLALDPAHMPALKALDRLYTSEERWIELVDVYERQVELVEAQKEAIELLTRVAGIWEDQFRDLEGASKTLIRILEVDPEHLPTVKSLIRVWRQAEDWEHLIEALDRNIELTQDKMEMVSLYLEMGEIYVRELGRADAGEEAFTAALDVDPSSREAIHALGQLHERHGNWFNALEMLHREAGLVGSLPEAVEIYYRIGSLNEEMLMDPAAAKEAFGRALDIDPSYTPAIRALRKIHEAEGNWAETINLEAQEAEYTDDLEEKAELFQIAADTSLEQFDDEERATGLYERSLEAQPNHLPSLRTLSDIYFATEQWEASEKLLERLTDRLDRAADSDEMCRAYYRLAYISEKLDDDHAALKRYLASYELDSSYLPTLEGLAAALLRAERWEDAQRIFQTILIQHKPSLTDAEVVDLHFSLGELAMKLEQIDRARKSFDKALALDAEHGATLRAAAQLAEKLSEWEEAYDFRDRLIMQLDGDEKFEELVRQARLCYQKIGEPYRAIDAYAEARRIRPDDVDVLRALVHLFEETSQFHLLVEVLQDLGRILESKEERRDTFMHLSQVYMKKGEPDIKRAVEALNSALDQDPMHIQAFSRIEEILSRAKQWQGLEQNYHRMLERMPKENKKARVVLWKSLAELYANVLKNADGAKVALEVVYKLSPESTDVALQLAALHSQRRETAPKALGLYHDVIANVDDPAQPARRLFELYSALGQRDRAFCALGALQLMRAATDDETRAYQLLLKRAPTWPSRALTDNLWRTQVLHPTCRKSLADILSVLYRGAPELFNEGQRQLALKKKERVDLEAGTKNKRVRLRYFDVWQRLSNAMHVGPMEHFHRPGTAASPRLYPGGPPVLYAGEQHEVFKVAPPRQIAWSLARQMAAARPELAPVRALSPEEVGAAIEAAICLFSPEGSGVNLNLDPRLVQLWMKNIQRTLPERALKALKDPVVQCLQKRDMRLLAKFLEGAEHSASRAALLMAGDVMVAERGLGDSDQLVDVSFRNRVRTLMLFTLSEEHFQLREKLGLAIPAE